MRRRQYLRYHAHPDSVFLLSACVVSGVAQFFYPTLLDDIPAIVTYLWATLLTLGSLISVIGTLWPRRLMTAISIEIVGRVILAPASVAYGALTLYQEPGLRVGAVLTIGLGVSCLWRIYYLYRDLRKAEWNLERLRQEIR